MSEVVPRAEAHRVLAVRRLRGLGIARPEVLGVARERYFEEVDGEPAEVEGTSGSWVVDPTAVGQDFEGRTALLSPFDRLVHDRVRARELFDFEYYWRGCHLGECWWVTGSGEPRFVKLRAR